MSLLREELNAQGFTVIPGPFKDATLDALENSIGAADSMSRAWSRKEGVWHVLPPVAVLEKMLTARIHLDSCDANNGALQVIPGSHRHGRLTDDEVDAWKSSHPAVTVAANRGDILLMRPLLLHASSASHEATEGKPRSRRVVHLEYAAHDLPEGIEWHERLSPRREV